MTLDSVVTAVWFFACFITSDTKFPTIGKQAYNIRKFFSTNEPIWTVYTTGPTRRTCEVDSIKDLTKVSVYFTRTFLDGTARSSKKELGTFNSRRKKHMDIYVPGGIYTASEDILYMSENRACAVIMVTTKLQSKLHTFDLRVRNSSVRHGPGPDCVEKYREHERREQVIYKRECQHILDKHGKAPVHHVVL
uniref:Lipocalin n=1 Tax=Rhipicephalus zambeziensis TaxID=60191 RepID=A0A224YMK0_9ACAR